MGDQTEEPKSASPHTSHANAELSTGTCSAESAILRPVRALKSEFPWRPTQGRGWYLVHKMDCACLPLGA